MGNFLRLLQQILGSFGRPPQSPPEDPPVIPPTPKPEPSPPVVVTPEPPEETEQVVDPNRRGTFIIPDIYPPDLGPNPNFHVLPGMVVQGKEVIGCCVKASQGLGWGKKNEDWFRRSWKRIREVGGDRYGIDWFREAYHFLVFTQDGAKQADYFCDLVDSAGGWGEGDLMPMVDVEEGGQGNWSGGERLETITDPVKRKRLADEVTKCTTDFVRRFKERTGLRIAVYGRGVYRDLRMTDCRFGADGYVNPAYTVTMPTMDKYGIPLDEITQWQLNGDGEVYKPGFPSALPGWGAEDYSVFIDGPRKVDLVSVRRRCLAKPR